MNHARIAEWILSLALPTERAIAVAGDLTESVEERGRIWFWSCVIRLAAAKIWQDLSESPSAMVRLGVRGFIVSALAPAACMLLIFVLLVLLELSGHGDIRARFDRVWTLLAMLWIVWIFKTGRAIARRTPGREIAACLAVAAIGWIAIFAAAIFAYGRVTAPIFVALAAMGLVYSLTLFCGAMETRQERVSRERSA